MEEAAVTETAHLQQVEALGSTKATEVTQLGQRHMTSISKQVMISGGKESMFMPGEKEGGSAAHAASDTFSVSLASPAHGKHAPKGVFYNTAS